MRWLLLLSLLGCAPEDDACPGATLEISAEVVNFGDVTELTRQRRTILLRNTCGTTLHIEGACVIQPTPAFFIEGPDRDSLGAGQSAGVRVSYDPPEPEINPPAEDPEAPVEPEQPEPHRAVLLITSDAHNTPVRAIALCARALPEGQTATPYLCPAPEADLDLQCPD